MRPKSTEAEDHSFTLPIVSPEMRYLLKTVKTTTTGMQTKIDAAAYSPHWVDMLA